MAIASLRVCGLYPGCRSFSISKPANSGLFASFSLIEGSLCFCFVGISSGVCLDVAGMLFHGLAAADFFWGVGMLFHGL